MNAGVYTQAHNLDGRFEVALPHTGIGIFIDFS
jgi:hypothetical protein